MCRIVYASAVLLEANFALQLTRHPVELANHRFDLGDFAPLLVDLKRLEPNKSLARLHRLLLPRSHGIRRPRPARLPREPTSKTARGTSRCDRLWRDKVSVSFPPRPIPAADCLFPLPIPASGPVLAVSARDSWRRSASLAKTEDRPKKLVTGVGVF